MPILQTSNFTNYLNASKNIFASQLKVREEIVRPFKVHLKRNRMFVNANICSICSYKGTKSTLATMVIITE